MEWHQGQLSMQKAHHSANQDVGVWPAVPASFEEIDLGLQYVIATLVGSSRVKIKQIN